jgi:hydrogenase 3 maturation protease
MRGDDGVGSLLVRRISGHTRARCIDAGIAPENFLEKIVQGKPDTVLIVDAANFGGNPGDIRILEPSQLVSGGLSSHALSLQMACDYLSTRIPVEVYLLAIQPGQMLFEHLSDPVQASLDLLMDWILEFLPKADQEIDHPTPGKKVTEAG